MGEKSRQEIIAEIESALQEALEPFLYTALIPGGGLHFTDRALIEYYASAAINSVLQKHLPQGASMFLQKIKDATTKENFGDPERNWLISECDRLGSISARCRELGHALAPFANMGSWGMKPGDRPTKLDRDCERAARVLYGEEWHPPAGTNKGRMAEFIQASEENHNVEPS